MAKKIPLGPDHLYCPLWRKPMSKVCHTCPWWTEVRGDDPQTGQDASDWQCAITWGPILAINIAQQARQAGAAVESFRNESTRQTGDLCRVIATGLSAPSPESRPLIGMTHDGG